MAEEVKEVVETTEEVVVEDHQGLLPSRQRVCLSQDAHHLRMLISHAHLLIHLHHLWLCQHGVQLLHQQPIVQELEIGKHDQAVQQTAVHEHREGEEKTLKVAEMFSCQRHLPVQPEGQHEGQHQRHSTQHETQQHQQPVVVADALHIGEKHASPCQSDECPVLH